MDQPRISMPPVLARSLSLALVAALLPFVFLHCLPLLRPVGTSIAQSLWNGLVFVAVTAALLLGILNGHGAAEEAADAPKGDGKTRGGISDSGHASAMDRSQMEGQTSSDKESDDQQVKGHASAMDRSQMEGQTSSDKEIDDQQVKIHKNLSPCNDGSVARRAEKPPVHRVSSVRSRGHRKTSSMDQNFSFQPLTIPKPLQQGAGLERSRLGQRKEHGGKIFEDWNRKKEGSTVPSPMPINRTAQEISQAASPPLPYDGYVGAENVDFVMYDSDSSLSPDSMRSRGKSVHIRSPRFHEFGQEASTSPDELERRAEAFIEKFHEQMRLQRLQSLERYRQRLERGS